MEGAAGGKRKPERADHRTQGSISARRNLLPRDIQQEIGRYLPQREIIILTGVRQQIISIEADLRRSLEKPYPQEHPLSEF
jgi:hypothetical protein